VTIKGASYIDLVLTSVTRTDSRGQFGKGSFAIELRQIATVETKTVELPPVPASKAPKQLGAKPAKDVDEDGVDETISRQLKRAVVRLAGGED
jgi:hypothetical protein